jgi:hypothetical protein
MMNSAIEIHDSNLAGVESVGRDAVFHLDAAYVHRSEGRPGIDPGSGWLQDIDLVVSGAVIESLPEELPGALADGVLSAGGTAWDNLIPLPLAVSGAVALSMTTSGGELVLVHGSGAEIVPRGEPRFIEPFPGCVEG